MKKLCLKIHHHQKYPIQNPTPLCIRNWYLYIHFRVWLRYLWDTVRCYSSFFATYFFRENATNKQQQKKKNSSTGSRLTQPEDGLAYLSFGIGQWWRATPPKSVFSWFFGENNISQQPHTWRNKKIHLFSRVFPQMRAQD